MTVLENRKLSESDDTDPLIELHRIRENRAKEFNYDLKAMFEDLKDFEKKKKLKTVILPPKRNLKNTGS